MCPIQGGATAVIADTVTVCREDLQYFEPQGLINSSVVWNLIGIIVVYGTGQSRLCGGNSRRTIVRRIFHFRDVLGVRTTSNVTKPIREIVIPEGTDVHATLKGVHGSMVSALIMVPIT